MVEWIKPSDGMGWWMILEWSLLEPIQAQVLHQRCTCLEGVIEMGDAHANYLLGHLVRAIIVSCWWMVRDHWLMNILTVADDCVMSWRNEQMDKNSGVMCSRLYVVGCFTIRSQSNTDLLLQLVIFWSTTSAQRSCNGLWCWLSTGLS